MPKTEAKSDTLSIIKSDIASITEFWSRPLELAVDPKSHIDKLQAYDEWLKTAGTEVSSVIGPMITEARSRIEETLFHNNRHRYPGIQKWYERFEGATTKPASAASRKELEESLATLDGLKTVMTDNLALAAQYVTFTETPPYWTPDLTVRQRALCDMANILKRWVDTAIATRTSMLLSKGGEVAKVMNMSFDHQSVGEYELTDERFAPAVPGRPEAKMTQHALDRGLCAVSSIRRQIPDLTVDDGGRFRALSAALSQMRSLTTQSRVHALQDRDDKLRQGAEGTLASVNTAIDELIEGFEVDIAADQTLAAWQSILTEAADQAKVYSECHGCLRDISSRVEQVSVGAETLLALQRGGLLDEDEWSDERVTQQIMNTCHQIRDEVQHAIQQIRRTGNQISKVHLPSCMDAAD